MADARPIDCEVAILGFGPAGAVLANLLGAAGLDVVVVDRDGVFLFMNTPAAIALGEKNPRKLFNRTMWQLFPRHHADRQMNSIRKAMRSCIR